MAKWMKGVPSWYTGTTDNLYYQNKLDRNDNPIQSYMEDNLETYMPSYKDKQLKTLGFPELPKPRGLFDTETETPSSNNIESAKIPAEFRGKYKDSSELSEALRKEESPYENKFFNIFGAPDKVKDDYANKLYGGEFDNRAKEIWNNSLKKDDETLRDFDTKNSLGQFLDVAKEKATKAYSMDDSNSVLREQDLGKVGNVATDIISGVAGFLNPEFGIAKTSQLAEGLSNKLIRGAGKGAEWGRTALKGGLETLPQDFLQSNSEGNSVGEAAESATKQALLGAGFEVGLKGLGKLFNSNPKSNFEFKNNLDGNNLDPLKVSNLKNEMPEDIKSYVPKNDFVNMDNFANINDLVPEVNIPITSELAMDADSANFRTLRAERNKLNRKFLDLVDSGHNESADEVYNEILKISETLDEKPLVSSIDGWKDKKLFSLSRETADRNFEGVMGPDADNFKLSHLEPIREGEADRTRFLNTVRDEVKSLGIKPFSKESELVQKYGEGLMTLEELKNNTGDWQKIAHASEYMRNRYDEFLGKINDSLERNGYSPIPGRENYFPHQDEMQGILEKIGIKADELPTSINGITDQFTPGKSWFGNALQRKGDKTVYDAVRGFDNYIDGASKLMYHTDNIQRLRNMEVEIRNMVGDGKDLSNFVSNLHEYTNLLAGKKASFDRAFEQGLVGRQVYKMCNYVKSQVGANMVGANVSSALTNFIPLTQSIATTDKRASIKALGETIYDVLKGDNSFIDKSNFLTRRFGSDKIALTKWENVGKIASKPFEVVDHFTSRFIVNAKFNEFLSKGMPEKIALREADDYAARLMADRSLGQTPNFLNTKTIGAFTQFQTEVNNQLSFLFKDLPKMYKDENKIKGIGKLGLAITEMSLLSYGFNQVYEMVVGRKPALDPLSMVLDTKEDFENDKLSGDEKRNRFLSRIGDQLPFASVITGGRIPISEPIGALTKGTLAIAGIPFGADNTKSDLIDSAKGLVPYLLPTGGNQLRKTITGLNAFNGGTVDSKKGEVRYPVEQDTTNLLKGALFGPSGFREARNYYGNNLKPLNDEQSDYVRNSQDKKGAYDVILKEKQINESKNDLYKAIDASGSNVSKEKSNISKQLKDLPLDQQLQLLDKLKGQYSTLPNTDIDPKEVREEKSKLLNTLENSNKSNEQIRKKTKDINNKLKSKTTEERLRILQDLQNKYKRW